MAATRAQRHWAAREFCYVFARTHGEGTPERIIVKEQSPNHSPPIDADAINAQILLYSRHAGNCQPTRQGGSRPVSAPWDEEHRTAPLAQCGR
jgi:hypothetical protein